MTFLKKYTNPNFQYFATKERNWSSQANIMMDLDVQKGTFMTYELLRKILEKVRKVMKINEENFRKSEESYENR